MTIQPLTTTAEFDSLTAAWRTLNVYDFGPLADLDDDEDGAVVVLVAMVAGEAMAYLIADGREGWHIETRPGCCGTGHARALARHASIAFAWEVCSDEGAAFCQSLGIPFDDAR